MIAEEPRPAVYTTECPVCGEVSDMFMDGRLCLRELRGADGLYLCNGTITRREQP